MFCLVFCVVLCCSVLFYILRCFSYMVPLRNILIFLSVCLVLFSPILSPGEFPYFLYSALLSCFFFVSLGLLSTKSRYSNISSLSNSPPKFRDVPRIPTNPRNSKIYEGFLNIPSCPTYPNFRKSRNIRRCGVCGGIPPIGNVSIFYIFLCVILSFRFLRFLRFPTLRKKLYFPIVSYCFLLFPIVSIVSYCFHCFHISKYSGYSLHRIP